MSIVSTESCDVEAVWFNVKNYQVMWWIQWLPKKNMKKGWENSKMKVLKLGMKAKAKASSTAAAKKEKGKDLEKHRAKNKLNTTNLGNMSPKDKIKAAAEQGEDLAQQEEKPHTR